MKTKILTLCLTLAAFGLMPSAKAQYTYTTNSGSITITGYTGSGGAVMIPASTNGYPVTGIGELAFADCTSLTSVTIPNSVTSIGEGAFDYCTSLTSVTIGNSVTSIGDDAFVYCTGLTSVTLGNSVTSIGDEAFSFCSSLTSVTIPNSVTSIGEDAFVYCSSLTSVTLGNSVTSIGDEAFYGCSSLTNLTVIAGNPDYSSAKGVLFNQNQTTLTLFPEGLGGSYTIPNSVTNIGTAAFDYCTSLTSVTIPNSVTSIGEYAFVECTNLTSAIVPNSVSSIGDYAFYYCANLANITFLGNAPVLGDTNEFTDDYVAAGATVYYYSGTSGWSSIYGGLPTVELAASNPPQIGNGSIGIQSGNFSFTVTGVTNQIIVVAASTNLENWQPVWTNTLSGTNALFTDPQWKNYPRRFYRAQ